VSHGVGDAVECGRFWYTFLHRHNLLPCGVGDDAEFCHVRHGFLVEAVDVLQKEMEMYGWIRWLIDQVNFVKAAANSETHWVP
jgi:hypothetical protein